MIYVLIVVLFGGNSTKSIAMHDFNTLHQCQYAASTLMDRFNGTAYCLEKGKS